MRSRQHHSGWHHEFRRLEDSLSQTQRLVDLRTRYLRVCSPQRQGSSGHDGGAGRRTSDSVVDAVNDYSQRAAIVEIEVRAGTSTAVAFDSAVPGRPDEHRVGSEPVLRTTVIGDIARSDDNR